MPTLWNKADDNLIIDKFLKGHSFGEIAKMTNRSRCAVAGRLHRLKAFGLLKPQSPDEVQPQIVHTVQTKFKAPTEPEFEGGVDIMSLDRCSCRYPLNSSHPYKFCGEKIERGSYCSKHWKVCYDSGKKVQDLSHLQGIDRS